MRFGGEPLRLELPGATALLAYLVLGHDRAHARATIAGALWPDDDDEAARANVRRHLFALQRALPAAEAPWIVAEGKTLRWNPATAWWCDAVVLDAAFASGEGIAAALDAYGGDFLAGDEREWCVVQRERLRVCAVEAASALARDAAARGDVREALRFAQRAFTWEPESDPVAARLIDLLGAAGDRAGADAVYARFVERMRREFDAPPEPATIAAIERVRATPPAPRLALPVPATRFVGRHAEAANAIAAVRRTRLLTFVGPSGIGKTRLALAVAHTLAPEFRDGVAFADCSAAASIDAAVCAAFEIAGDDPQRALAINVRDKQLLIVVDNAHAPDAAERIAALVAASPAVTVLATRLAPLGLRSEAVLRVGPMEAAEAAQLFVDRAQRLTGEANAPDAAVLVDRVCATLDRFPLAIELAAGRLGALSLAELATRLAGGIADLADDDPQAPERHRALQAAIAWSYAALHSSEQQVLCGVSHFADGWTLAAAQAVCAADSLTADDVRTALDRLVGCAMVERSGDRFRLLSTVRAFACERAAAAGDQRTRAGFLTWAATLAERVAADSRTARQADAFADADRERANLYAAIEIALRDNRPLARTLLGALGVYLETRGGSPARRWLEDACADGDDGRTLIAAAGLTLLGDARASLAFAERARSAYERAGNTGGVAYALACAGIAAVYLGDVDGAVQTLDASLALRDAHDDAHAVAAALMSIGYVGVVRDDSPRAIVAYQRGLDIALRIGDRRLSVRALMSLSGCYFYTGDTRSARSYLERALDIAREIGHETYLFHGLRNLGDVDRAEGRTGQALIAYIEGFRRARDAGDVLGVALAVSSIAAIVVAEQPERAARLLGAAAAMRATLGPSAEPPPLVAEREATRQQAIAALGEPAFGAALRLGRTLSPGDLARELSAVAPEAMPAA